MSDVYITIEQGRLRGVESTDYNGAKFYSFLGIPYAQPPIKDLRFKAALPAGPWKGTFDATVEKDVCFQWDVRKGEFVGSENCLFLNVYTKTLPVKNASNDILKPVMVYIHGGAFSHGTGNSVNNGAEFLLTEDIVLVSINYRLGILGFLSLDDPSLGVPGNFGLKDMILALKWVQKNVGQFGGDRKNVTAFGNSAGAASVHYLLLSPLSDGLFHKAILQSGSVFNYWTRGRPISEKDCKQLGASNLRELWKRLRTMSLEQLHEIQEVLEEGALEPNRQRNLAPVIENTNSDAPLICRDPLEIIKSGSYNKVPLIIGFNHFEGLYCGLYEHVLSTFKKVESNISYNFNFELDSEEMRFAVEKIKNFYFGGKDISEVSRLDICRLATDNTFKVDILATIMHHLKTLKHPIYLYEFSLDTDLNYLKKAYGIEDAGASHADDLGYMFKTQVTPERIVENSIEDISLRRVVKLWTNFARFTNPTPDNSIGLIWLPTSAETMQYLDIGEQLELKQSLGNNIILFWRELYEKTQHLKEFL